MKRFLTLMVIPHNDDHVREFNLATSLIWAGATVLLLFILTAGYFGHAYYARQGAENAYADLKAENTELGAHLDILKTRMSSLSQRVGDLSTADTRMRAFARVIVTGPGGQPLISDARASDEENILGDSRVGYGNLDQLTREASDLAARYDSLRAAVYTAGDVRRSIPSIFPVKGEGWYSYNFGHRTDPITGEPSFNNGIDIAGRKGTPIVATADGRIDVARYHSRLGYMVSIDHGNKIRTLYAHLESVSLIRPGQRVSRGDVIGKMARTGRATAVNLHYAVILKNKAQDPLDYILDDGQRHTLY